MNKCSWVLCVWSVFRCCCCSRCVTERLGTASGYLALWEHSHIILQEQSKQEVHSISPSPWDHKILFYPSVIRLLRFFCFTACAYTCITHTHSTIPHTISIHGPPSDEGFADFSAFCEILSNWYWAHVVTVVGGFLFCIRQPTYRGSSFIWCENLRYIRGIQCEP